MSDATPRLSLPVLPPTPVQPQVTHNDALFQLDALSFACFLDRDLSAPPSSPADGDTYLVKATGSGAWTGQNGKIAYVVDGAWRFYAPFTGLAAYVVDESKLLVFNGGAWVDYASILALQNVPLLGVNTTADATNKLAVKSSALLFDNVGAGVQAKLNKNAAGDTASLLYQTGYSGRAEVGLAGDDDFHFKVSADGSTWYEALKLARASGAATFVAAATAPCFVPSGATVPANGLFLPAANTLGWSVGSAEKARLTSSGLSLLTAVNNGALTVGGVIAPEADNTRDLGTASFAFRNAYIKTGLTFAGTSVTAVTGTGNMVLSASPTLTGTLTAAAANFSGQLSTTSGSNFMKVAPGSQNVLTFIKTGAISTSNVQWNIYNHSNDQDFYIYSYDNATFVNWLQLLYSSSTLTFNSPSVTTFQKAGSEIARFDSNGYLLAGYTSSNGAYRIQCNSQMFATNATIATSDLRRKTVVAATRPYRFEGQAVDTGFSDELLTAVRDVPALMYSRKDEEKSKTQFGYGAQHWQLALDRVAPPAANGWRAVQTFEDGSLGLTDSDAHTLKIAALEHFKADRSEVEDLRARLARLEAALRPEA